MIGGVLALDVATVTGWAYGPPGSIPAPSQLEISGGAEIPQHTSGWKRLSGASTAQVRKFAGIKELLLENISLFKPSLVVFEKPYVGIRKNKKTGKITADQKTPKLLLGLAAIIELVCDENGIRCFEANNAEARKYFCGKGGGKRDELKRLVEMRCAELGWKYDNDDEADALGLLDFTLYCLQKRGSLPQPIETSADSF